ETTVRSADAVDLGTETMRCSGLSRRDGTVLTAEHLASGFAGMGIDHAYVDLSAPEVPIMDGSAGPFVFLLQSAGLVEQNAPKRFIRIREPVEATDGDKLARFLPHDRSEEHTSELQSRENLVCRLLLEKKK